VERVPFLPSEILRGVSHDRGRVARDAAAGSGWSTASLLSALSPWSTAPAAPVAQSVAVALTREPVVARSAAEEHRALANDAMTRYAQGDDRAFDDVYTLLSPRLYRLCIHLIGRGEADDLLQEVFLKIHRARASFVPGGSVVAWSFAIARTTCVDRMRRKKRRPEDAVEQEQLERHGGESGSCPEAASSGRALEGVLEAQLAKLSESLRSAYVLVKLEGMSCAEAGAVLGASTSAVKQRVHRATEELRAALTEAGW